MTLVGLDAQDGIYVLSAGPQSATLMELGPTGKTLRAASAPLFGGKAQTGSHVGGCVLGDGTVILVGLSTSGGRVPARAARRHDRLDHLARASSRRGRASWRSRRRRRRAHGHPSKPVDPDDNGAPVLGMLDVATGAVTTTAIALHPASPRSRRQSQSTPSPAQSGDFLVLLASGWLVDVLPSGVVQGSVLVQPTLVGFTGKVGAVTARGSRGPPRG